MSSSACFPPHTFCNEEARFEVAGYSSVHMHAKLRISGNVRILTLVYPSVPALPCSISLKKIQIVADTSVREVDAYKKLREDLRDSMRKTESDISELKARVARERVVRQHKEEYALLAQQVTKFDHRSKTQRDNDAIQVCKCMCPVVPERTP